MRIIWVMMLAFLSGTLSSIEQARVAALPPELCDNALDDDGDGRIDLQDEDCVCEVAEARSLIPNPSFEQLDCCPQNQAELDCAVGWLQASEATTDFMNECGWRGWSAFPAPTPIPDGKGFVGFRNGRVVQDVFYPNWKEYLGTCLTEPMKAGEHYRIQFDLGFTDTLNSPPIDIAFFGHRSCSVLPFGEDNPDLGCPSNDTAAWVQLGVLRASGKGNWSREVIDVRVAEQINAIVIGPDCSEQDYAFDTYYFLDNLILDQRSDFDFEIRTQQHPCDPRFTLEVALMAEANYQWYHNGIALLNEKSRELRIKTGPGNYQVRVTQSGDCKLSAVYSHQIPVLTGMTEAIICEGEIFEFFGEVLDQPGLYQHLLKSKYHCDSLVYLELQVLEPSYGIQEAWILPGEQLQYANQVFSQAGVYQVALQNQYGCDSLMELHILEEALFIPNAFSPNGDGLNDHFQVYSGMAQVEELLIFTRWGELVYQQQEPSGGHDKLAWNGERNGHPLPEGTYVYLLKMRSAHGEGRTYGGTLHLIR